MVTTLKNHPIWNDLDQALRQLDPYQIAMDHMLACEYQVNGYWDDENFYELISFSRVPSPELISSSWGVSSDEGRRWLQMKFALNIVELSSGDLSDRPLDKAVGELTLILDDSLEVIDENWLIDVHSPLVVAVPG
jgi:hypothetical protein